MKRHLWSAFLSLVVLGASALQAELVWESTAITVNGRAGDASATGIFRFINHGPRAVRIISVNPSCGCTVAKPAQELVEPNGSGELPAKVALSHGETSRSVSIKVSTDEGPDVHYDLSVSVHLAEAVQMVPRLLYWKVGEPPIAKRITLQVRDGVEVTGVEVQGSGFSAQLSSPSDTEPVVWVTPTDTQRKVTARLRPVLRQSGHEISASPAFLRVME